MGETVFGPGERADCASARGCEKFHQFFTLWTLKGALIESSGAGFPLIHAGSISRTPYVAA
ncbi:MAG: hypothetical protein OXL41_12925 [Nitrospinae bacterium]|nr:hypothetical protein [Nitrospinota bacterium]